MSILLESAKGYQRKPHSRDITRNRPQAITIFSERRQSKCFCMDICWDRLILIFEYVDAVAGFQGGRFILCKPRECPGRTPHCHPGTRHTRVASILCSPLSCLSLQDNRDADAFLKPVSRTDYPDYYESKFPGPRFVSRQPHICAVIEQPMDLGTMLKYVKTRKYKSKQEFAGDLNLIWKNCFKYNSGPVRSFTFWRPASY